MSSYGENFSYSSYLCKNEVDQTQNKTHSKLQAYVIPVLGELLGVLVSISNGIFLHRIPYTYYSATYKGALNNGRLEYLMDKFRSEGGILLYQLDCTISLSLAPRENSIRKSRKHDKVNHIFSLLRNSDENEFLPDSK